MAEKLDIDIGPGNILQLGNGGLTDGTKRIGKNNYFYDNSATVYDAQVGNTGQRPLEIRYNTNNGIVVLVEPTTSTVLFQSVPGGSSNFTQEGLTLIKNGDLNVGVGTMKKPLTTEDVLGVIKNESTFAGTKWTADAKASSGTQRAPIVNNVLKSATGVGTDGKVQATAGIGTNPPPAPSQEENNNPIKSFAESLGEGAIALTNKFVKGIETVSGVQLDKLVITEDMLNGLQFGSVDDAISGTFTYPIDATYGNKDANINSIQDHIQIAQFKYKPPYKDNIFKKGGSVGILTSGSVRTTSLEKFIGLVNLPMPNSISDSNSVNWGEDQMNDLNAAVLNAYASAPKPAITAAGVGAAAGALTGIGGLSRLATFLALLNNAGGAQSIAGLLENKGSGALIKTAISSRILAQAGIQVSPESILARGFGVVPNSNMELLFNSPTLRSFQFSWKLSPRSLDEALMVNRIVRFFKQGMAVKKINATAGSNSLFLGTPNIFKLKFKTQGRQEIEGVNKIKPCAIKTCSVNYTPEQIWSSYENGQPVSIQISLTVQELEPIYDTDYQENIENGRSDNGDIKSTGDLTPVKLTDIGY